MTAHAGDHLDLQAALAFREIDFWNALGGIAWAASIGFGVFLLGRVAERVISTAGPVAAGLVVLALAVLAAQPVHAGLSDKACWGDGAQEMCLDSTGNLVPGSSNMAGKIGTATKPWAGVGLAAGSI